MKELYQNAKTQHDKQNIRNLLCGRVTRKYRVLTHLRGQCGLPKENVTARKKSAAQLHAQGIKERIAEFYERDDISRLTTGKKDTITKNKVKKQKRLLNDSMKIIHTKFLAETSIKVSYSLFTLMKPF